MVRMLAADLRLDLRRMRYRFQRPLRTCRYPHLHLFAHYALHDVERTTTIDPLFRHPQDIHSQWLYDSRRPLMTTRLLSVLPRTPRTLHVLHAMHRLYFILRTSFSLLPVTLVLTLPRLEQEMRRPTRKLAIGAHIIDHVFQDQTNPLADWCKQLMGMILQ